MKKYKFDKKLKEALLIRAQGWPVPTSIFIDGEEIGVDSLGMGGIKDGEYGCLVSQKDNGYVVEAVAFDALDARERHWICLKPAVYDDAVEFFLKNNYTERIVNGSGLVRKCGDLQSCGLDFVAGDTAIGVKLPLMALNFRTETNSSVVCPFLANGNIKEYSRYLSAMRGQYRRVVLLTVCQYGLNILMQYANCDKEEKEFLRIATSNGLEFWTAKVKYGTDGIRLLSYKNMTGQLVLV